MRGELISFILGLSHMKLSLSVHKKSISLYQNYQHSKITSNLNILYCTKLAQLALAYILTLI